MSENKTPRPSRIPQFHSIEEEAEFWDTHSTADYEDEFKPVRVTFAKNLSEGITIRLDPETLRKVRVLAKEKGIGPTVLIRMWIMERLKEAQLSS
jgi:predicted DNA binding CopG/RHH family protein